MHQKQPPAKMAFSRLVAAMAVPTVISMTESTINAAVSIFIISPP
jgi:hypothetical protein